MVRDDEHWLSVIDVFNSAAIDGTSWHAALTELAAVTGSRSAQLCGEVANAAAEFNWITEFDPEALAELPHAGGDNPSVNTRLKIGAELPVLKVFADGDFLSEDARRSNSFFSDFSARYDIPFSCQTSVVKDAGTWIGLAVIRSAGQGEIGKHERSIFASIAPHVRAAVRTQIALEHQGPLLVAGAMEAMSLAVFVCDRGGVVKAMTPAAEALVIVGGALRLRHGQLGAVHLNEARTLSDAIGRAAGGLPGPGSPVSSTVLISGKASAPLVLEVVPLPRRGFAFGLKPCALVVVHGAHADPVHSNELLQIAYGLTAAEADVAVRLYTGQSPQAIAMARGATIGTVRAQIRSIYAKLGVNRQCELASRLHPFR